MKAAHDRLHVLAVGEVGSAEKVGLRHPQLTARLDELGDTVKVEDPQKRWRIYQNKKSEEAINKVGEIVGYKYVAGAYSKYAVKLANGNIYGIHSHFLRPLTAGELATAEIIKRLPELEGVL